MSTKMNSDLSGQSKRPTLEEVIAKETDNDPDSDYVVWFAQAVREHYREYMELLGDMAEEYKGVIHSALKLFPEHKEIIEKSTVMDRSRELGVIE